jgi:hypothetical protein
VGGGGEQGNRSLLDVGIDTNDGLFQGLSCSGGEAREGTSLFGLRRR